MKYLLGIDQGTTQTTAVIVDECCNVVAKRSVQVPARFPRAGWVEQEPADILRSVKEACGPLIEAYEIAAVGLDNQGETFLLWDRETGEPLTPAIVWQDTRGAEICRSLKLRVNPQQLRQKTGLLLDSYFTAPKLKWVFENHPEIRARAHGGEVIFGTMDSWVIWNLTHGRLHVTDPSTASRTLLFDINRGEWDDDLLALFDIPRCLLPDIKPSAGLVGEIDCGNGRPLALHAMLVDQQAALFGQACLNAGEMKCSFGTGAFVLMNTGSKPRISDRGLLTTVGWSIRGETSYALDGGILVAGSAVQWLGDHLKLIPDPHASSDAAKRSRDLGVVAVPALQGLAAPHWRTDVRGAMFNLNRSTNADDLVRATLDGIACRTYEVVNAMVLDAGEPHPRLKVDGGMSGNPYLMQMIADLLDLDVCISMEKEATAIGIAQLAGLSALGITQDEIASHWKAEAIYKPAIKPGDRAAKLAQWDRALEAVKVFHARPEQEGAASA